MNLLKANIKIITKASIELQDKPSFVTETKKDTRLSINKQTYIIKERLRIL